MLREDHSAYCRLFACTDFTAENTAREKQLIGLRLSVSPRDKCRMALPIFKVKKYFSVQKVLTYHTICFYRINLGVVVVEHFGKKSLRVFLTISSELHVCATEWPDFLPFVQGVFMNTIFLLRVGIPLIKGFTGSNVTPSYWLECHSGIRHFSPLILVETSINSWY